MIPRIIDEQGTTAAATTAVTVRNPTERSA
jgi:hypothetical protein